MLIGEIISKYPEVAENFFEEGIFCVGCGAANYETLEQGLKVHGKTDKEIKNFVEKLNKAIK